MAATSAFARSGKPFAASERALRSRSADCLLKSGPVGRRRQPDIELRVGRQLRDLGKTEQLPPLVDGLQQILRRQRRNLEMQQQGIAAGLHLRRGRLLRRLQLVLGGVEGGARLPDLVELEDASGFPRSAWSARQDEAQDLAARQRDLRDGRRSRPGAAFTSASAGTILGFFGSDTFRVIVADFPSAGMKTRSSTKAASGNFVLSTCGPCSATDRPLVPRPVSRPICPVRPNSIASITPLLPEPFGPEIANVPF